MGVPVYVHLLNIYVYPAVQACAQVYRAMHTGACVLTWALVVLGLHAVLEACRWPPCNSPVLLEAPARV